MTKKNPPPPTIEVSGAEIAAAVGGWLAAWKPRPKLTLSEWSAQHAKLDNGKRFKAYPFQRDIADAFTDPRTRFITVKKSSRVGYSQIVQNFAGYTIAQQPRRLLIYQPTIDDAEKYSRDDLEPVLQWPAVRAVATFKPRHRDNQIRAKRFKGGWIQIKGTNSPKEFRRVTCDVVLLEEPDGYPQSSGVEGDPGELAYRRNTTSDEPLSAAGSTPILAGLSRIDALFLEGTQEYRFVPCPTCGQMQKLVWGNGSGTGIRWEPKEKPTRAWYRCENGCDIEQDHKGWMDEHGEWRAAAPENGPRHRSFHIWAAYSQHEGGDWLELARQFLAGRKNPDKLKTFVNQILGEVWQEKGEAPEWERLYHRREKDMQLGTPPSWAGVLVWAVDTQRAGEGRLEADLWAFGSGRRRALVKHEEVEGTTADKATWDKLDTLVHREWKTADGRRMKPARVGIDSGDGKVTMQVYAWARRNPGFVMALKGRHALAAMQPIAGPTWMDLTIGGRKIPKGVKLWTVGTSMLKLELYGDLQLEKPVDGEDYPDGYVYLPDGTTDEWIKQLVAEQFVTTAHRGRRSTSEWRKTRDRNEALDNAIQARAVASALGVDRWTSAQWKQLTDKVPEAPKPAAKAAASAAVKKPAPRVAPKPVSNWLNRRGR